MLIAQGGRFGGWSLYCRNSYLSYAYNCYGRDLSVVRATDQLSEGAHVVRMEFEYDGGDPGSGAGITLYDGEAQIGTGRLARTTAYYFSFDETLNVGVDRGTPVTEEYAPLDNAFGGVIDWARVDLWGQPTELTERERQRQRMAHQ